MLKSLVEIRTSRPPRVRRPVRQAGGSRHPRRDRLRGRRDDHHQGGLVRGSSRHDQRDQARERQAHRARLALRARDPGRAQLRPGHQALAFQPARSDSRVRLGGWLRQRAIRAELDSAHPPPHPGTAGSAGERPDTGRTNRKKKHGTEEEGDRPDQAPDQRRRREPRAAHRAGAGSARREHHGVLQGVQRGDRVAARQRHPGRDHRLRGPLVHVHPQDPAGRRAHQEGRRRAKGSATRTRSRSPSSPRTRCARSPSRSRSTSTRTTSRPP